MTPDIVPWSPPKFPAYKFFQRDNQNDLLVASYHPSWSITWGWFVNFHWLNRKRGETGRFCSYSGTRYPNGGGQHVLTLFWLFTVRYHWQELMAWPPSMQCTRCGERREPGDMMYCGARDCKLRDSKAVSAAYKLDNESNEGRRPS